MESQIENFIAAFKDLWIYELLAETLSDDALFEHSVKENGTVVWMKEQTRQIWKFWIIAQENHVLQEDCIIDNHWFMKGMSVHGLIQHAADAYKAKAVAQNSNIEFGTDDNEIWWAHEVPYYGTVQMNRLEEHGLIEWDIVLDGCWQGPFDSKDQAIQHLVECIEEKRQEEKANG